MKKFFVLLNFDRFLFGTCEHYAFDWKTRILKTEH